MVLIVDDEPGIREVMALSLETGGYGCIAAADGREALAICAERGEKIDAVITDLHMPNVDGITLIRHLRELRPELTIMVSSGQITEEKQVTLGTLRVTAIIAKPYTATQFLQVVRQALYPEQLAAA